MNAASLGMFSIRARRQNNSCHVWTHGHCACVISLRRTVATVVGLLYLLKLTISVVSFLCPFIKSYILAPCGLFRLDLKKYGSWAGKIFNFAYFFDGNQENFIIFIVVTGASEGIGKGYAIQVSGLWNGCMTV